MSTLVIAEHDNNSLKPATLNTLTAANQFGADVHVLVYGANCAPAAASASTLQGVKKILHCEAANQNDNYHLAENISALVYSLAENFTHILAPATTFGKNFMPRVAALLDVAQVSEISKIIDANTFVRPIYAGNVLATVQSSDAIKVITVRASSFRQVTISTTKAPVESIEFHIPSTTRTRFIKQELSVSSRPELNAARVVISGGRGLQSSENFKLLEALADKLGAAIGASRAAVDAGFVPNDFQVGQTGKVVAPDLYIAVGISGAIQHLAGMKDSKVIVAINKDPDAPIFQIADYGMVGDLFSIIPELTAAL